MCTLARNRISQIQRFKVSKTRSSTVLYPLLIHVAIEYRIFTGMHLFPPHIFCSLEGVVKDIFSFQTCTFWSKYEVYKYSTVCILYFNTPQHPPCQLHVDNQIST